MWVRSRNVCFVWLGGSFFGFLRTDRWMLRDFDFSLPGRTWRRFVKGILCLERGEGSWVSRSIRSNNPSQCVSINLQIFLQSALYSFKWNICKIQLNFTPEFLRVFNPYFHDFQRNRRSMSRGAAVFNLKPVKECFITSCAFAISSAQYFNLCLLLSVWTPFRS